MKIDPQTEAKAALSGLLDKLAYLVLTIGIACTAIGLVRVTSIGWHPDIIGDLALFLPIVVVILLRKKLPLELVVWSIIGFTAASAVASFLVLGLVSMSFVALTACCVVTGVVFGMRAGFLFLTGSVAVVSAIGFAICRGMITDLQVTDPYLLSPQTWIAQITGFVAYTSVVLVVAGALLTRISSSLREVSRQAEELRESERKYRLLADNMKDVLFFQDMNLEIKYTSPSAEKLLGYTVDELLQMKMEEFMTPESLERAQESFQHYVAQAIEGDVEVPQLEFEYVRRDGSTLWGELTLSFIRDSEDRLIGTQGLLRDITLRRLAEQERAELEHELRQAEKLKAIGQLAGGIAHDFNNQLAPIMAHADLLGRGLADPDSVADHARRILASARNAADLTAKLLAFARKGSYEHVPVDMHEVIRDATEILKHGIDKRITLKRHYEADTAVIEGDHSQLQNVILNLALNARDAMSDGGEIIFKTRTVKIADPAFESSVPWLEISVEDTGEGMEEDVLERAFEPFFSTKAPGKGTGMGLAAAYGTVASHKGRIEVASRLGQGTTVSVTLPISSRPIERSVEPVTDRLVSGVGTVMVVDDEDSVRVALGQLLEHLGYTVMAFGRAGEAMSYFADNWQGIDFVILDLVLPDVKGPEVLTAIRKVHSDVRVLLVSGYTADDGILKLLRSGRTEFLEKPFLLADLAESLARLTG